MAGNINNMGQPMNSMGQPIGTIGQPMNTGQPMNPVQSMGPLMGNTAQMGNIGQPMNTATQSIANLGQTTAVHSPMGNIPQPMSVGPQPMSIPQPMSVGPPQPMTAMGLGQPMAMETQPVGNGSMGPPSMAMVNPNGDMGQEASPQAPPTLVDDFERAFLACLAPLMDQDMTRQDSDEMRAGVQQSLQKFLESAKSLEAFFLQKRLMLSVQKPELLLKEDINELRAELARKDALIQKHYEKLQTWQEMLTNIQQGGGQPAQPPAQPSTQPQPTTIAAQSPATPAQQTTTATVRHPQTQMSVPSSAGIPTPQTHHMQQQHQQMQQQGPQFPTMRSQFHPTADMMQGPLAKLERSTANIGMPDGWQ